MHYEAKGILYPLKAEITLSCPKFNFVTASTQKVLNDSKKNY